MALFLSVIQVQKASLAIAMRDLLKQRVELCFPFVNLHLLPSMEAFEQKLGQLVPIFLVHLNSRLLRTRAFFSQEALAINAKLSLGRTRRPRNFPVIDIPGISLPPRLFFLKGSTSVMALLDRKRE